MSFTFVVLRQSGQRYDRAPLTADDSELSLSNENAHDVLDALGIEDTYSSSPWSIAPFRALLTATRRKRLGHQSAAIATTGRCEPGRMTIIECGRPEGYVERRLKDLSDLVNRGLAAGATHIDWGNSQISAVINPTSSASAFQIPQYPRPAARRRTRAGSRTRRAPRH